ncbi:DUF3131 domain-containing protein [Tolypothrix sp. PCC 7910]|uniref:DUF3131 domain-containing protein n=1 Tax=Tolypothrix sp. PCC 7910 TaxID=2099387 RepID=UPI001AD6EBF6|nr:DUF3131 domain-containing protein [Tolypothrix sp. PCC 7910]
MANFNQALGNRATDLIGLNNVILESALYLEINRHSFCPQEVWQCTPSVIIAAPDNFNPDSGNSESTAPVEEVKPVPKPTISPPLVAPKPTPEKTVVPTENISQPRLTKEADLIAAQRAWKYFERNWNPQTGLVNSSHNIAWTTWWDQGSAVLGIFAARQLNLLSTDVFRQHINTLLKTLETLPLPATGLPNKAYSTSTAQMQKLNNTPDPEGKSGWSALDLARFLLALHILRSHYPEYSDRINHIVAGWKLTKLVKDGWLNGGVPESGGKIREVQEGRLGYEQYAAHSLKLWNIQATKALAHPPSDKVQVDGITLEIDRRNLKNSGATNYLTNDPYLLLGLEIGWTDAIKAQAENLLKVQVQRFKRTNILTAVNEDSLDRPPYFLYYSVYANGVTWPATSVSEKSYPHLRFISTKAAFSWYALMPDDPYTKMLRDAVQNLASLKNGYFTGKYENQELGINNSLDVNTNAVILESLLYQARKKRSLIF